MENQKRKGQVKKMKPTKWGRKADKGLGKIKKKVLEKRKGKEMNK